MATYSHIGPHARTSRLQSAACNPVLTRLCNAFLQLGAHKRPCAHPHASHWRICHCVHAQGHQRSDTSCWQTHSIRHKIAAQAELARWVSGEGWDRDQPEREAEEDSAITEPDSYEAWKRAEAVYLKLGHIELVKM